MTKRALLVSLFVGSFAACGAEAPVETTPIVEAPKGPDFQVFAPLPKVTMNVELPFITGENVENTPCFKKGENLAPVEGDFQVKDTVDQNRRFVEEALRSWFVNEIGPSNLSEVIVGKWTMELGAPWTMELPVEQVRFVEKQGCIEKDRGWLPAGQRLVTAVYGVKEIKIDAKQFPLNHEIQQEMLRNLGADNIMIESDALFVYEPSLDNAGQPMMSPDNKKLFKSPSGELIEEDKVPAPETLLMDSFTIKSERPIWFAFHELAKDQRRKEAKKENCDVFLIWDDLTPRAPDCGEFQESAFSAIKGSEKDVALTITTGADNNKGLELSYNELAVVQVSDRVILWLKPEPAEEGVKVRVDSLVLDPKPLAEGSGAPGFDEEGGGPTPSAAEEPAAQDEDEKPAKKAKKKSGGDSALDGYLND